MSNRVNFRDHTGIVFNKLTGIKKIGNRKSGGTIWLWKCSCGAEKKIIAHSVTSGRTKSCGHLNKSRVYTPQQRYTRGSYRAMLRRCYDKSFVHFFNYGGRGIFVCEQWLGKYGFKQFLADMGERPVGMSLDRIKVNGNYEPTNCKWSDREEQNKNRRKTYGSKK